MSKYVGGRIVPKHCGTWDSTKEYEVLSIVMYSDTGDSYISRKAVPAGVDITDAEYWAKSADYSAQLNKLKSDVDDIAETTETLKSQIAANVTASTDSDADYAAEVVDARIRYGGTTEASLGEVIREIDADVQSGLINKLAFTSATIMADKTDIDSDATYVGWLSEGQHNFDFHWYKTGESTTGYCYCFVRLAFGMTIEDLLAGNYAGKKIVMVVRNDSGVDLITQVAMLSTQASWVNGVNMASEVDGDTLYTNTLVDGEYRRFQFDLDSYAELLREKEVSSGNVYLCVGCYGKNNNNGNDNNLKGYAYLYDEDLHRFSYNKKADYALNAGHAEIADSAVSSESSVNAENAVNAENSVNAVSAENAGTAKSAETAVKAVMTTGDIVTGITSIEDQFNPGYSWGATITDLTDGVITVNATNTYGEVGIGNGTLEDGKTYFVAWINHTSTAAAYNRVHMLNVSQAAWNQFAVSSYVNDNGDTVFYAYHTADAEKDVLKYMYLGVFSTAIADEWQVEILAYGVVPGGATSISESTVKATIAGTTYNLVESISELYDSVNSLNGKISDMNDTLSDLSSGTGSWKGKNVLYIGDSLTAAKKYPDTVAKILGTNTYYHCKGGIGIIAGVDGSYGLDGEYDNETDAAGDLRPLDADDVADMDLIVLFIGYNNRGTADGEVGDCYDANSGTGRTIAGMMQYAINRIYEELEEAGNTKCHLLVVTVDCSGRYPYIDADGYTEYPAGSGYTMETLANIQKAVAEYNSIPCVDLWHNSGINKFTWSVFGNNSYADNEAYSPYELDADGNAVSDTRIKYVKGTSYYQWRDGEIVLEEYTGSSPYPYNGDQLHKNSAGYERIGECIAGGIISAYGN